MSRLKHPVDAAMDRKMEEEANYFAMCLLMPEELIREEVKDVPQIDIVEGRTGLKELAHKFAVSEPMMLARLIQLEMIQL